VLLVPLVLCTDWLIPYTRLGGGDTRRAIAATPINSIREGPLMPGRRGGLLDDIVSRTEVYAWAEQRA